jgi:hypothetical protein
VGLGNDYRFEAGQLAGFGLAFEDEILHISIFSRVDGNDKGRRQSRMARYTERRQNRR